MWSAVDRCRTKRMTSCHDVSTFSAGGTGRSIGALPFGRPASAWGGAASSADAGSGGAVCAWAFPASAEARRQVEASAWTVRAMMPLQIAARAHPGKTLQRSSIGWTVGTFARPMGERAKVPLPLHRSDERPGFSHGSRDFVALPATSLLL